MDATSAVYVEITLCSFTCRSRRRTVGQNHSKSLILQNCERSELRLFEFSRQKSTSESKVAILMIFGAKIQIFQELSKVNLWHENSNETISCFSYTVQHYHPRRQPNKIEFRSGQKIRLFRFNRFFTGSRNVTSKRD